MKKIPKKKKLYIVKHANSAHLHNLKRQRKRKAYQFTSRAIQKERVLDKKFLENPTKVTHKRLSAPEQMSLTKNPITVIKYFNEAKTLLQHKNRVFFDMTTVKEMGPETLTLFCALITDRNYTYKTTFAGESPRTKELRHLFETAGFYDFVAPKVPRNPYNKDIYGKLIHRVSREKVDTELAKEVCISAIKHTFKITDNIGIKNTIRNLNLYNTLVECMANTCNHANYGDKQSIYNWWLLAYKDPNTLITKFCFLDIGIGIFGSLKRKHIDKKMATWLKAIFVPERDVETLEGIFAGERATSTGLAERGLGLKAIYNHVKENNALKNFTVLSNDIIAVIEYNKKDRIEKINTKFEGTLFYWELIPNYE